ncbi:AAA family ATPase [Allosalinactinospora lopnorensis]|uniref:AAA family ATPase n=1 Tax=Allosalinactinospora lopnorensis TaxID=1352348 RepID=UPI0030841F3A
MTPCWELRSCLRAAGETGTVLFDRDVPDIVGCLRLERRPAPEHIHIAAQKFRYHRRVSAAPPCPGIYERDNERKQSFRKASPMSRCSQLTESTDMNR